MKDKKLQKQMRKIQKEIEEVERIYGKQHWNLGKHRPKGTKEKISETLKGRKLSEQHREKIRKAKIGKKLSAEHRRRLKKSRNVGLKNPNWKGGISFEPYSIDWTETLKRSIRERDNYICQLCSRYGNAVHHIDYDKKNCDPDNLITLCVRCNTKVNFNRDYWINYFQKVV